MTTEVTKRPCSITACLGDQEVTINRLGTRAGLDVARVLLRYIVALREPLAEAMKDRSLADLTKTGDDEKGLKIAMDMLERVQEIMGDDDFLKIICAILGQPSQVVGPAPLEDTMNALADGLAINDMPALLRAGGRLFHEVGQMMEGVNR